VLPISQITSDSLIEFVISGQNGLELLDLQNCLIYVKAKITKADGSGIAATEDIGPVNLFLPSLFSQVDVTLQGENGRIYYKPLCLQGIHSKFVEIW